MTTSSTSSLTRTRTQLGQAAAYAIGAGLVLYAVANVFRFIQYLSNLDGGFLFFDPKDFLTVRIVAILAQAAAGVAGVFVLQAASRWSTGEQTGPLQAAGFALAVSLFVFGVNAFLGEGTLPAIYQVKGLVGWGVVAVLTGLTGGAAVLVNRRTGSQDRSAAVALIAFAALLYLVLAVLSMGNATANRLGFIGYGFVGGTKVYGLGAPMILEGLALGTTAAMVALKGGDATRPRLVGAIATLLLSIALLLQFLDYLGASPFGFSQAGQTGDDPLVVVSVWLASFSGIALFAGCLAAFAGAVTSFAADGSALSADLAGSPPVRKPGAPIALASANRGRFCTSCGTRLGAAQRFCGSCGTAAA